MTARRIGRLAAACGALALAAGQAGAEGAAPVPPAGAKATYFRAENVAKSFASGAVLFAGDTHYMIHTSRREKPGQAEVHTLDTDLIHVIEGAATFVTGGRAIDLKNTAPGEWRGSSIEGGETRLLAPGDVVIVPAGVPHWFQDVRGPVLYYTVKVRPEGGRP